MRKIIYLSTTLLAFLIISSFVNTDELLNKVINNLEKFRQDFPQEKVYLHADRHLYAAGETLWFKAYLTAGINDQLSPLSKTLYVQLLDQSDKVVLEKKLYIENGLCAAEFELPLFLDNGNYTLRAYTHWMRNFDANYFFYKKIKIQSLEQPSSLTRLENNDIDLQFFPEGGSLVENIRSKVAFKAIGTDGLGKDVSGFVYNSKSEKVAEFKSLHFGMGHFFMIPQPAEKYYATIDELPGKKFSLPQVNDHGVVISVSNQKEQEDVVVRIQAKLPADKTEVVLVANSRGYPSFAARLNLLQPLAFVRIPKSNLLHGISQLVILDTQGTPLNERLIYHESEMRSLVIKAQTEKEVYPNRSLTRVSIDVKDPDGKPVKSFLSLSAIDRTEVEVDNDNADITSYLHLSSELNGFIENPSYYFDTKNSDRTEALENLLLTQGWSRFVWKELIEDNIKEPEFYIERGLNIIGKLVDNVNKKPIDNGRVTYFNIDGDAAYAKTGKNGMFLLNDLVFFDTTEVVLQGQNSKGKRWVKFEIDPEVPAPKESGIFKEIIFESDFDDVFAKKSLERRNIDAAYNFDPDARLLDAVSIRAQRIEESEERKLYAGATKSLSVNDIPGADYMVHPLQLLQGRMAGVQVIANPPGYDVLIRGVGTFGSGTSPLILFDNMPVDISFLNAIPATEIENVDVFMGAEAALFGVQGANGVIAFYSRKGGSQYSSEPGIINIRRAGYSVAKEFYKPKYDVKQPEHVKPDKRVTLHWEPMIKTDANGKAWIEFYNHDNEADIEIRIEGITESGIPGVSSTYYKVSKNTNQ